ncbi:MAG: matrixin family metalloprotease [Crocinitomix sp.]|nr:matrixin family metalloprotease [Crocinitomix sp.]
MRSNFTFKNRTKKTALALVGVLLGSGIGWSQGERSDFNPLESVALKYRTSVLDAERIYPDTERDNEYLVLHFNDELPTPESLNSVGIESLNWMNPTTIFAHVSASTDLAELPNFAWGMELSPQDKIQKNLLVIYERMETSPVLLYLPHNLDEAEIASFVATSGLTLLSSPALPGHVLMTDITEEKMNEIAASKLVSWISLVPPKALTGEHFHFCLGASSPYGHQAEFASPVKYVLQGSDWDGAGLGCADLTYHFENGTPDIAGAGEEVIVENAMAEWVLHAGLTFTETGTVGLANSIDISWASGDHGDGNAFDGPSGTLAHAYYPQYGGEMHFDEAETWTTGGGGIDLFAVAVHELGHALGLAHSDNGSAVMAPYYAGAITGLHSDDIAGIQALYSSTPCGGGAVYCASSGTNSSYEWIDEISVGGTTNNSGNNSGYGNFTTGTAISLSPGSSAAVNLVPGFSASTYNEFWNIWIDYDKDNTFDASELVYSGSGTAAVSGSFSVPSGLTGDTRMRISMKWNADATPCETFSYGEVEDYTVSFAAAPVVYCTSQGTNSSYEWINSVSIGGAVSTTGDDGGYGDHTASTYSVSTGSYPVVLTPGFSGSTYNEFWNIWIDLNGDGTFSAGEKLFSGSGTSAVSGTMTIPSGYEGTTTRMRISMKWNADAGPCETFSYGEVEDYTISIAPAAIVAAIDEETLNYTLYPNPTADILNIMNGSNSTSYQLFDASGRLLDSGLIEDQKLSVSHLASGHYVIRLSDGENTQVSTFIRK